MAPKKNGPMQHNNNNCNVAQTEISTAVEKNEGYMPEKRSVVPPPTKSEQQSDTKVKMASKQEGQQCCQKGEAEADVRRPEQSNKGPNEPSQ
tara:strand:+ start:22 stop:297 length:276 start_codon:yes stop_codon:yes gene_type:complete